MVIVGQNKEESTKGPYLNLKYVKEKRTIAKLDHLAREKSDSCLSDHGFYPERGGVGRIMVFFNS